MIIHFLDKVSSKFSEKSKIEGFIIPKILFLFTFLKSFGIRKRLITLYEKWLINPNIGITTKELTHLIPIGNFITKGKIGDDLLVRKLKYGNETFELKPSKLFSEQELDRVCKELKSDGFSIVGNIKGTDIYDKLTRLNNVEVFSGKNWKQNRKAKQTLLKKPNPAEDFIWYVDPSEVISNTGFQNLILDEFWRQIAKKYLNCDSKIFSIRCWHSFVKQGLDYTTPENWHLDAGDGFNFIKVFVLLSDVNENSGPTQIIPINQKKLPRKYFVERRFSDREIKNLCKKKNVKVLSAIGPAGTVYVADTRQIHRGTPVTEGKRFILNFNVAVDDFGGLLSEKYNNNGVATNSKLHEFLKCLK